MTNLIKQIKKARIIWVCGNGGSASTAEHFTTDLIKKGYPAVCLSASAPMLTMIANDYGYDQIFSKQLEVLGQKDDLLITLSCSGASRNVLRANKLAYVKLGMGFYSFESFQTAGQHSLRDYQLLEDKHLKFAHEVANAL